MYLIKSFKNPLFGHTSSVPIIFDWHKTCSKYQGWFLGVWSACSHLSSLRKNARKCRGGCSYMGARYSSRRSLDTKLIWSPLAHHTGSYAALRNRLRTFALPSTLSNVLYHHEIFLAARASQIPEKAAQSRTIALSIYRKRSKPQQSSGERPRKF